MKPPICPICHRTPERDWIFRHGDYVTFADYQSTPNGMVGHPQGFEWFCGRHVRAAAQLAQLSLSEALERLR